MTFSEREGYKERVTNQLEGISADLKTSIFNTIYPLVQGFITYGITGYGDSSYKGNNAQLIWTNYVKKGLDELPDAEKFLEEFKSIYNSLKWYEIYDLIEFLISLPSIRVTTLTQTFNSILEKNNSPYRLKNKILQPISSKETISIIEAASKQPHSIQNKKHAKQSR